MYPLRSIIGKKVCQMLAKNASKVTMFSGTAIVIRWSGDLEPSPAYLVAAGKYRTDFTPVHVSIAIFLPGSERSMKRERSRIVGEYVTDNTSVSANA